MSILRGFWLKLWRRRGLQRDLQEELRFHRDMARDQSNPIGLGNAASIEESARDLWRFNLLEDLRRDLVYACRSFRRTPGFAAAAIVTLALGIGANTAIFSLMYRVMIRPLPVQEPERLIEVLRDAGKGPGGAQSYQALQYYRRNCQSCSTVLGISNVSFHTVIKGEPVQRMDGQFVTGDFFSALGVHTVLGRPITPADDQVGRANTVAVISYALWQELGGRSDVLGQSLTFEKVPFTVIGVAPREFHGLEVGLDVDVWVPLEVEREIRRPSNTATAASKWLQVIAVMKPGITFKEANAELALLFRPAVIETEIAARNAADQRDREVIKQLESWRPIAQSAASGISAPRRRFGAPLNVLMAIVVVLLLIACANVASLLFARALSREKEIALRLSLGSGRGRLVRQLIAESVVLSAAGAVLGLGVAYALSHYFVSFLSTTFDLDVKPNLAIVAFTAVVGVGTALVSGLLPAFRSTRMDFASGLKSVSGGWEKSPSQPWRSGLVVVQVGLLMVLVLGAGMFLRTLHSFYSIDLGFDPTNVLIVNVDPFGSGHTPEELRALAPQLIARLEALPGVTAASLHRFPPITGGSGTNLDFVFDSGAARDVVARGVYVNRVSENHFATLKTPILAGRDFNAADSDSQHRVVLVNQTFALRYFGQTPPLGRVIQQRNTPMEIVGVVADTKYEDVRQAMQPTVYYNIFQQWGSPMEFLVRAEIDPEAAASSIRSTLTSLIGNVSIRERTLSDQIDSTLIDVRLVSTLAASFGALALLLAVVGLYGLVSNSVARRTREIGIRIALGMSRSEAVVMVLREALVLAGGGIVVGLPLAIVTTRYATTEFEGLIPDDPLTMIIAVGALLLAAIVAGFLPARRASRLDPMAALRTE